jgi:hypothetical protein
MKKSGIRRYNSANSAMKMSALYVGEIAHCSLCTTSYNFMELNSSWEHANCATTQELPNILFNRKVHCRVHKTPPLVPILSQSNANHTISSYLSNIHFNTAHPPTSWSSQWSLSFFLSHKYPLCSPLHTQLCYIILPLSSSLTWSL